MEDLGLKTFNKLYPMMIRKYKDLIVDQNANETDKINQIISKLNALGKLSNDVVRDWNTVYQWVMNDGLTQAVQNNNIDFLNVVTDISQLPTPSINYRFKRYAVQGSSGVADAIFICKMLNDGTYDWIQYV